MRRVIALMACLLAGCFAALALTAQTARAGLTCATDTAAAVAGATLTNRGLAWSSPEHPDPTWTVDLPSLNASYDLQAPDDAGARAAVKAILDGQIASMGCGTTTTPTTAPATTTAPPTTVPPVTTTVVSTQTQTTTATQTVSVPPVIVVIPSPAQTVTATVTTPPRTVTVKAAPAKCPSPATKKKGAR